MPGSNPDPHADPMRPVSPSKSNRGTTNPTTEMATAWASRSTDFQSIPGALYSVGNLANEFNGLAAKALGGDEIASRTLLKALELCTSAPRNSEDLAKIKSKSLDPNFFEASEGSQYLNYQLSLSSHCGFLSEEQFKSSANWVGALAKAGDSEARLKYPFEAQPLNPESKDYQERRAKFVSEARNYLDAEISAGNVDALNAMAGAYMPSPIQGQSPSFDVDQRMAYQYYYAYAMAPESATRSATIASILIKLESGLNAAQIEEARAAGVLLYQSCCTGK